MDNVHCDSSEASLFECNYRDHWFYCSYGGGAGVRCRDSQLNVQAISVALVNMTCNTLHIAMISWKLHNSTKLLYQPTSNVINCFNEQHSIELSVDHDGTFTTTLGGLLPSATYYICCVTPVYGSYEADKGCVLFRLADETSQSDLLTPTEATEEFVSDLLASNTPTNTQEEFVSGATVPSHLTAAGDSDNRISIVGGVLGFIIAVLLILLAICGGALLCLLTSKRYMRILL